MSELTIKLETVDPVEFFGFNNNKLKILKKEFTRLNISARGNKIIVAGSQEDLEIFRSVPGLLQKYYITEEFTGAISGIYIFETKRARESFWTSELAKNIPARYGVILNTLRVEQYDMAIVLNDVLLA